MSPAFLDSENLVAPRALRAAPGTFARDFNRTPFLVAHDLQGHPLFTRARLATLARALLAAGRRERLVVLGGEGSRRRDATFADMTPQATVENALDGLAEGQAWMKLAGADEVDPDYRALLDTIVRDIEDQAGVDARGLVTWRMMTVMLASPGVRTPYHIDHESNFLLQVAGEKDVCLFDGDDRSVLTLREIEGFYGGNADAARYRDELDGRGTVFRIRPGTGVHHPPLAPHWVQNGAAVSISVSVNLCLRPLDDRAKVHQANMILRRLGLRPPPLRSDASGDRLKVAAMRAVSVRRPGSRRELLYSGVQRLSAPAAAMRRLRRS